MLNRLWTISHMQALFLKCFWTPHIFCQTLIRQPHIFTLTKFIIKKYIYQAECLLRIMLIFLYTLCLDFTWLSLKNTMKALMYTENIWSHAVNPYAIYDVTCWLNFGNLSIKKIFQIHKQNNNTIFSHFQYVLCLFYLRVSLFCLPLCIINHPSICHEIPHLPDTQKGRLCLFFIWTVGDGARCLAAAECSGVTVLLTGHDEHPQMKDEAWRILERGAPLDLLLQEYTQWMRGGKTSSAGISFLLIVSLGESDAVFR